LKVIPVKGLIAALQFADTRCVVSLRFYGPTECHATLNPRWSLSVKRRNGNDPRGD